MKPLFRLHAILLASATLAAGQPATDPVVPEVETPEAPAPELAVPEAPAPDFPAVAPGDVLPTDQPLPDTEQSVMGENDDVLGKLAGDVNVSSTGGAEVIDFAKGIFRYKGGVNIRYRGVEILGDGAEFNRTTGDITVRGEVSIFREGMLYKGTSAVYNIKDDSITSDNLRSSLLATGKEIYFQTQELASDLGTEGMPDLIETNGSMLTTHDSSHPNWHIQSKELDIYPDDKLVFKNLTFYAGGTPFFWLPYLSQPMDDELGYSFTPGYDTLWGAYLLNRYGTLLGDTGHTLATYHLDLRSERGIAGGIDLRSMRHRKNPNFGQIRLYYASDLNPALSRSGTDRSNPPDDQRYRASLQHRFYLKGYDDSVAVEQKTGGKTYRRSSTPVDDSLYVDVDINVLSDEFFLEDFSPAEFRTDPRPDNNINLVKTTPYASASLLGRFHLNDFFQSDTRLPEAAIDFVRTPILGSNFFYEGTTSYGVLEEVAPDRLSEATDLRIERLETNLQRIEELSNLRPDFEPAVDPAVTRALIDELRLSVADRGFNRFDTYHQVAYPTNLGPVSIVPRGGLRFTNYSSVSGVYTESADRALVHGGIDASFKISKEYDGVYNRALGLDGLRHIIQPYARYSIVQGDELDTRFPAIDRLTPTTRPRPIDLGRYPATDSIDNWNLVRLGVFNRWQTKRDGGTHEWLAMNTYFDSFIENPESDDSLSNLYWEMQWNPLPWLGIGMETQFNVFGQDQGFNEFNPYIRWMPTKDFEFSVSNRYLADHPFLIDSNQVILQAFYRIADEWGVSGTQVWQLEDSVLQTQQYSIHKDLISWTAALGAIMRDNRGEEEFGIAFTMTLKEFPQISLPLNLDPQSSSGL